MKKSKGFTLIELLAVIVILAIIALISVPMVLKYIENTKEKSLEVSAENIKDAALKYAGEQELAGKVKYPMIVDVKELSFKGKEKYTGKVIIKSNETVEEYIETNDYTIRNGIVVNKKEPYLTVKENQTAVIDDKNNFVYSFYNDEGSRYTKDNLSAELLNNIFKVENGTIEFETRTSGRTKTYSTGAKIKIKDNAGNVYKEYQIVIFGDIDGSGGINTVDSGIIYSYLPGNYELDAIGLMTADVNFDGKVTDEDFSLLYEIVQGKISYHQITHEIKEI